MKTNIKKNNKEDYRRRATADLDSVSIEKIYTNFLTTQLGIGISKEFMEKWNIFFFISRDCNISGSELENIDARRDTRSRMLLETNIHFSFDEFYDRFFKFFSLFSNRFNCLIY